MDHQSHEGHIYTLSADQYESRITYIFWGTSACPQEEFEDICKDLMPEAASRAVLKDQADEYPSFVGVDEVIHQLGDLLQDYGFSLVKPKAAKFFGSCVLDRKEDASFLRFLGPSSELVVAHNQSLRGDTMRPPAETIPYSELLEVE